MTVWVASADLAAEGRYAHSDTAVTWPSRMQMMQRLEGHSRCDILITIAL